MIRKLFALFLVGSCLAVAAVTSSTVVFSDKAGKNQIKWTSTAPMENIDGIAELQSGSMTFSEDNWEATSAKIVVDVKSMKTGIGSRDKHLVSKTWLDASAYPTISYNVNKLSNVTVTSNKDGRVVRTATAHGTFTLRGVSKNMDVPITITRITANEKTRERVDGDIMVVKAEFDVALADYNVKGKSGMIGEKVGESIEIVATLVGEVQ